MENVVIIVTLTLGVILYFLSFLLKRQQSMRLAYIVLGISICLIALPLIHVIKIAPLVRLNTAAANYFANFNNPIAIAKFDDQLENIQFNYVGKISPTIISNLNNGVTVLNGRTNLTAESYVALSRAQLLLGKTSAAAATLKSALVLKPQLANDPKVIRFMLSFEQPPKSYN